MANLIKVERIIEKDKEQISSTKIKLLVTIFPDYTESGYNSKYNGVHFKAITDNSFYNTHLMGIQLEAGSYNNMLRRRIMIKGGCIDADALWSKYEEVKLHANDVKKSEDASTKYRAEVKATYDSVLNMLGIDQLERWRSNIHSDTKDSVKIDGETDWRGLKLIEDTLKTPITIKVKLSVPIEHAKLVYETLNSPDLTTRMSIW